MTDREIYPNAPIALVACEIRYTDTGHPTGARTSLLRSLLRERLPLAASRTQQNVRVVGGGPPEVTETTIPRFTDRSRTSAVTVSSESVIVDTTEYHGYDAFRPLIEAALDAVDEILTPDGVERVGLRYLDEIRVPEITASPGDWSDYLAEELVIAPWPGDAAPDLSARTWQGVVQYDRAQNGQVIVRYGPRVGYAVDPNGPLRRPKAPPPGPFFLVDIDSFWEAADQIPEYDPAALLNLCDELHKPVRSIFEASITKTLRDSVLRKVNSDG